MFKKILLVLGIFIFIIKLSFSQELNCIIQIQTPGIEGTDRKVYETLQTALYEFMNNRRWTNYTFTQDERIECSILITITEKISTDEFKGTVQVQARRPIYKSSYNSTLLNYIDKDFSFKYVEMQPLDYSESTFTSNLTSVMAFWAYIIIGYDFDSFSEMGGTPFFETAQTVVNNAQNAKEAGWKAFENQKNRYWFVENLLNKTYKPIRESSYKYHRLGFDIMTINVDNARTAISESLELLKKASRERPGSLLLQQFFFVKSDELVNIYSEAPQMDKAKTVNILNEIDPANISKYKKILVSSVGN